MVRGGVPHYGALERRTARLAASLRGVVLRCTMARSSARFSAAARRDAARSRAPCCTLSCASM
eukprot:9395439-Lingulodinium_polyedra.AAC.1